MTKLLYTEQLMWVRQEKARENGQNYMKLSPNDIELLLNTIRAERCLNENLTKERDTAISDYSTLQDEYNSEIEVVTALGIYLDQAHKDVEELTAERDALKAELETMRGLCKTLEVNLSGQNDTVEEMHGEVMRLKEELGKADDIIFQLANINDALWDTVDLPSLFKKAAGYRNRRENRKVVVK